MLIFCDAVSCSATEFAKILNGERKLTMVTIKKKKKRILSWEIFCLIQVSTNLFIYSLFTSLETEILLIIWITIQFGNSECINPKESYKEKLVQNLEFHVVWGKVNKLARRLLAEWQKQSYLCVCVCVCPLKIYSGINSLHTNADLDAVLHFY